MTTGSSNGWRNRFQDNWFDPDSTGGSQQSSGGSSNGSSTPADDGLGAGSTKQPSPAPINSSGEWVGDLGSIDQTPTPVNSGSGGGSGGSTPSPVSGSGSGLVINVTYDSSVSSAPAAFTAGIQDAVSYLESIITTPITVNIDVGYGEIDGQSMESGALGESETYLNEYSYSSIKSALANVDPSAAATLPSSAPGDMWLSDAQAEALGLAGTTNSGSVDAYAGFSSVYPFAYSPTNRAVSSEYDFIGVVEHEFTEDMGRIDLFGESLGGGQSGYSLLDLFHYTSQGTHTYTGTTTDYFSVNGGKTALDYFNSNPSGDLGDWASSAGDDSFLAFSPTDEADVVSQTDITEMNALGFEIAGQNGIVVAASSTDALQGGAAVAILSGAPVITDSAKTNLTSATVQITNGSGSAVTGDKLFVNGQQSGTLDGGLVSVSWNSSTSTLTLTGTVSIAEYQTLLSEVTYQDTGTDSSTGSHPVRTVTWTANDGTNSYTTTSNVTVDRAPVASNNTDTVLEGSTVTETAATGVLTNDTDADSDSLTVTGVSDTGHGAGTIGSALAGLYGSLTLNANGSYTYVATNTGAINAAATGSTPQDVFTYTVSDGNGGTSSATLDIGVQRLPTVTTANINATAGQAIPGSSLFTASDPDGLPITEYQFWQVAGTPGYFLFNGVLEPGSTAITVTPAQLSELSFVTGTSSTANVQIRAYDGQNWSAAFNAAWAPFNVNVSGGTTSPSPGLPIVTTANINATPGEVISGSSLFSVSDPDNLAITEYEFWQVPNTPGYFEFNGAQQPAQTAIVVTPAQLSELSFVAGSSSTDNLQIRAYDGTNWSAAFNASWSPFDVNVSGTAPSSGPPVVTTANINATPGEAIPGSSLFSVSDPANLAITEYQFWQVAGTPGYFLFDGVQEPGSTAITVTPAQLSELSFVAGASSTDNVQIRAYDGTNWSAAFNAAWAPFDVNVVSSLPPVVTTSNINATPGEVIPGASLFSATDPGGLTITDYEFWQVAGTPGYFEFNGVQQPTQTAIEVAPSQLGEISFVAGASSTDNVQIRAYDGTNWSAAFNAAWAPFDINVGGSDMAASNGSLTVGDGSTLDVAGSDSGPVTFAGDTGTLVLDQSSAFSGEIFDFTGNGNPASSDAIDLADIAYGPTTAESYNGSTSGGTLTVGNGTDTANLLLAGNYEQSTFTLSSDGNGGTLVIDPPLTAGNGGPSNGQQAFDWHSGANSTAPAANGSQPQGFWNQALADHAQWMFEPAGSGREAMANFGEHDSFSPANSEPNTSQLASLLNNHPHG